MGNGHHPPLVGVTPIHWDHDHRLTDPLMFASFLLVSF